MPSRPKNRLLYGDSERCPDILYATGLAIPDPFLYVEVRGRRLIIVSPLEYGRAVAGAREGVEVLSWDAARREFGLRSMSVLDQIAGVSKAMRIKRWEVPFDFPAGIVRRLRARHLDLLPHGAAFFPQRACKTEAEVALITDAQRCAEAGLERALAVLRAAEIAGDELRWQGDVLTAERVRGEINACIAGLGAIANHTIVAPGPMGAEPHNAGSGVIRPHTPVVIDIFPRVTASGYFGDLTRTVVKGTAPDVVREVYAAVQRARDEAIAKVAAGADAKRIHQGVCTTFRDAGFETDVTAEQPYGFIHGTGHGVGLEIHEAPRISRVDCTLEAGHVVTVEPGLYYPEWGGVRLENLVVVDEGGCRDLTAVPDILELA
jgi:Xaa-Pro aminopeptidase